MERTPALHKVMSNPSAQSFQSFCVFNIECLSSRIRAHIRETCVSPSKASATKQSSPHEGFQPRVGTGISIRLGLLSFAHLLSYLALGETIGTHQITPLRICQQDRAREHSLPPRVMVPLSFRHVAALLPYPSRLRSRRRNKPVS